MTASKYWYLAISSCFLYVIISNFDIGWGFVVKPVYATLFYLYYYKSIGRHNIILLVFQLSALISEVCLLSELNVYFDEVIYFFMIATAMMLMAFMPILKVKPQVIKREMLAEPILGIVFCTYVIAHLLFMFYENVPNKPLFILSGILLWIFTMICTLIPLRNRHPSNIHLYIIAASLLIEATLGFIYYYSLEMNLILSALNIAICVHKASVTSYFIQIHKIKTDSKTYY